VNGTEPRNKGGELMDCVLCKKHIDKYTPAFNHLVIDEQHEVDICQGCIDAFVQWQGSRIAVLFPTKTMKKIHREE
jgi:hypothetical protein